MQRYTPARRNGRYDLRILQVGQDVNYPLGFPLSYYLGYPVSPARFIARIRIRHSTCNNIRINVHHFTLTVWIVPPTGIVNNNTRWTNENMISLHLIYPMWPHFVHAVYDNDVLTLTYRPVHNLY